MNEKQIHEDITKALDAMEEQITEATRPRKVPTAQPAFGTRQVLTHPLFPGQVFRDARALKRAERKVIAKMQAAIKKKILASAKTPEGQLALAEELKKLVARMGGGAVTIKPVTK